MKLFELAVAGVLAACTALAAPPARAQAWPSRPLTMIVPQGAGGSTDALARLVAQALGERLGQTVVVDNKAGAGGVLGVSAAAKAPGDGYTLLLGSNTTMAANTFLYANVPFDPLKDFVPAGVPRTGNPPACRRVLPGAGARRWGRRHRRVPCRATTLPPSSG